MIKPTDEWKTFEELTGPQAVRAQAAARGLGFISLDPDECVYLPSEYAELPDEPWIVTSRSVYEPTHEIYIIHFYQMIPGVRMQGGELLMTGAAMSIHTIVKYPNHIISAATGMIERFGTRYEPKIKMQPLRET